jgi:hypothetical protein
MQRSERVNKKLTKMSCLAVLACILCASLACCTTRSYKCCPNSMSGCLLQTKSIVYPHWFALTLLGQ